MRTDEFGYILHTIALLDMTSVSLDKNLSRLLAEVVNNRNILVSLLKICLSETNLHFRSNVLDLFVRIFLEVRNFLIRTYMIFVDDSSFKKTGYVDSIR